MQNGLATLTRSEDGKTYNVPKSRLGTPQDAAGMVFRYIDNDITRGKRRAQIKGQYDGNTPMSRSELRTKGMADKCNLNFRQATAIIDQFKSPLYDLTCEVPLFAEVVTSIGKLSEQQDWSQGISEEFHRLLDEWENFDFTTQFHQIQMLIHGIGHEYHADELDWRTQTASVGQVLVADDSPTTLEEMESVVILDWVSPVKLYRPLRAGRDKAIANGWDPDAVEKACAQAYPQQNSPGQQNSFEWYQQQLKNGNLFIGGAKKVPIATILTREFDDTISHHIIRADRQEDKFLLKKMNRFKSFTEVLHPFFYDIGDGTWHSINGMGKAIYAYCEIFNLLRCKEIDGANIASSVLLQQMDANSLQKAELMKIANMGIIPAGYKAFDHPLAQGLEATMGVRRDMEQGLNQNVGLLQRAPGSPNPRKGQKQAMLEMQQAAQLNKGLTNRYYRRLDWKYREQFRRAINTRLTAKDPGGKAALAFQDRLSRRGIPYDAWKWENIDSVKATRSVGAGSAVNALMVIDKLMEWSPSYPEAGREAVLRMGISRWAGQRASINIMGPTDNQKRVSDDDSVAAKENQMLRQGAKTDKWISDYQDHIIHATSHEEDCFAHIKEAEQALQANGQSPINTLQPLFIHLESAGPHINEHLQKLKGDEMRKTDFDKLDKGLKEIASIHDKVQQQLEEAMQAEEQQPKQPQISDELLKNVQYDKSPESVKAKIEAASGIPRAEGDLSVSAQNMEIKRLQAELKIAKQRQQSVHDDIRLSQEIKNNGQ